MKLQYNASIARYNSWHVGGSVAILIEPNSPEGVKKSLNYSKEYPIIWLGLGSNILFQDGLLEAVVIRTKNGLNKLYATTQGVYAEAGVSCAKLSRTSISLGYEYLDFFAGVPGTVGGALAMNAGAFGGETWKFVSAVQWLWPDGSIEVMQPSQFQVGYRSVVTPKEGCFWGAWFNSKQGSVEKGRSRIKSLLQRRQLTQPIGKFSCGSVFKNPEGQHAAKLIESCGLKGLRVGGAQISHLHANFIINVEKASCENILELVNIMKESVYSEFSVKLETEFHLINQDTI